MWVISSSAISPTIFDLRQNARFAHVDVTYSTLFGLGYAATACRANLARGQLPYARYRQPGQSRQASSNTASTPGIVRHTALSVSTSRITPSTTGRGLRATSINLLNPV